MTVEFGLVLGISAIIFGVGLILILVRRRIAENAAAAGAKGMSTPRSAASLGAFFIAIGLFSPLIVLVLNPDMATSWNLSGVPIGPRAALLAASMLIGLPAIITGAVLLRRAWRVREHWTSKERDRITPPKTTVIATVLLAIGLVVAVSGVIVYFSSASS